MADESQPSPITETANPYEDLILRVSKLEDLVDMKFASLLEEIDAMEAAVNSNKKNLNGLSKAGLPNRFLDLQNNVKNQDLRIDDNAMGIENTTALYIELSALVLTNTDDIANSKADLDGLDRNVNTFATNLQRTAAYLMPEKTMVELGPNIEPAPMSF
mmetsp:Transcript_16895/g.48549  ORF Transcript_16895/g.48549 Transcript_16895/m.48549 type:complete len:159 (+) Transcript_16895:210-686(+)